MDSAEKRTPDLLKNIYNHESLSKLTLDIQSVYSEFQSDEFLKSTMNEAWKDLELKGRIVHISANL